ncbi:unnamed protein product [Cuscuta epithymum]|uniref:Uncharacterized protein n=1 Tax=Cuscuta epithymum TaxID=186058 RepID=A0AAV0C1B6_9ASTE|nr:unnamed protein product [Cuscuta epithymum]
MIHPPKLNSLEELNANLDEVVFVGGSTCGMPSIKSKIQQRKRRERVKQLVSKQSIHSAKHIYRTLIGIHLDTIKF